jgi:hypothetical protein
MFACAARLRDDFRAADFRDGEFVLKRGEDRLKLVRLLCHVANHISDVWRPGAQEG